MSLRTALLGIAITVVVLVVPASGQTDTPTRKSSIKAHYASVLAEEELRRPLINRYRRELGEIFVTYWEPRLAGYKQRIDVIFDSRDLESLNRLRRRFALMVALMSSGSDGADYTTEYADTTVAVSIEASGSHGETVSDGMQRDEEYDASWDNEREATAAEYSASDGQQAPDYDAIQQEERAARRESRERELDRQETAMRQGSYEMESALGDIMDYYAVPSIAKWLAEGYRTNLDVVGQIAISDLAAFADTLDAHLARFVESHHAEIAMVPNAIYHLEDASGVRELQAYMRRPLLAQALYTTSLEQFVLLYSGGELAGLFGFAGKGMSRAETGEVSMIVASAPNPSSTATTITYVLPSASSRTALRVYDEKGGLKIEADQSARERGEHSATLDVSTLSPGFYLCQLGAQFAHGERTSARLLHVIR